MRIPAAAHSLPDGAGPRRRVLTTGVACALVVGGALALGENEAAAANEECDNGAVLVTCRYDLGDVGAVRDFVVPAGVESIGVVLGGGKGGNGLNGTGGEGGRTAFSLDVDPLQTLGVWVGGPGSSVGTNCSSNARPGGISGGTATGGTGDCSEDADGGGGGGGGSFITDGLTLTPAQVLAAAGGGGGGGEGGLAPSYEAASEAASDASAGSSDDGGRGGGSIALPVHPAGVPPLPQITGGNGTNGGGGGGGGAPRSGAGGNNSGGGGGCGQPDGPCPPSGSASVVPAGERSGTFRAAVNSTIEITYTRPGGSEQPRPQPTVPTPTEPPSIPPPGGRNNPGNGGPSSNDPNPNTNRGADPKPLPGMDPATTTARCKPLRTCTVGPPPGADSRFRIDAAGGNAEAILFATTNGNFRPASTDAPRGQSGRPDCPDYRERNSDWVQFGFLQAERGATWRKTSVMTQRQKLRENAATKLAEEIQICFAAPYAFPTRQGYRLGRSGRDRVGVLPECSSARVRSAKGRRPAPCVAAREIVQVKNGWVVRITFKIPANAKDPKALG